MNLKFRINNTDFQLDAELDDIVAFGGSNYSKPFSAQWKDGSVYDKVWEFNDQYCNGEIDVIAQHWDDNVAEQSVVSIQEYGYTIIIGRVRQFLDCPNLNF